MQKLLIVPEMTPTVKEWLDLNGQIIGVTHAGEYLLLANVSPMPMEKPKRRKWKIDPKVLSERDLHVKPQIDANGEMPRRRGRKPGIKMPAPWAPENQVIPQLNEPAA